MAVHVFGTSPSPPSPVEEVDTQNFPLDATLQTPQAASLDFLPLLNFLLRACGLLTAENCTLAAYSQTLHSY